MICAGDCTHIGPEVLYVTVLSVALFFASLTFGVWLAIHAADAAWRHLVGFWARRTAAEEARR